MSLDRLKAIAEDVREFGREVLDGDYPMDSDSGHQFIEAADAIDKLRAVAEVAERVADSLHKAQIYVPGLGILDGHLADLRSHLEGE